MNTTTNMVMTWLAIEPLDTVMVRDGRGFDAGTAATAVSTAPPPSTLGGAIRTAVGTDIDGYLVGPIVTTGADGPVFPTPQDIVRGDNDEIWRLAVRRTQLDELTDLGDAFSHVLVGEGDPVGGYLDADGLADWLRGDGECAPAGRVAAGWWQSRYARSPWHVENHIGLALRSDGTLAGTAEAGMLYSAAHLRPMEGMGFLVGCVAPSTVTVINDLVPLGGQGRLAQVREVDQPDLPGVPEDFPGGRVAVYLATPALLDDVRWHPPAAVLCAVALGGPQPLATASPREGLWRTRRLHWAVPAGTVYYLDFGDPEAAREWAHCHHGGLLPDQLANVRMVNAGFGTCLTGRWDENGTTAVGVAG